MTKESLFVEQFKQELSVIYSGKWRFEGIKSQDLKPTPERQNK